MPSVDAPPTASQAREREDVDSALTWAPSRMFLWSAVWTILAGEAVYLAVLLLTTPEQWFCATGPVLMTLVALVGGYLLQLCQHRAALHFLSYGAWASITVVSAPTLW